MATTTPRLGFLLTFLLLTFFVSSQNLSWQWAKGAGGTEHDYIRSVACDAFESVYVTGYFSSASVSLGSFTLTNAASATADMFIASFDASGNVLWAQRAGGSGNDYGMSVCISKSRNIYAAGYFTSDSIVFGSYVLTNTAVPGADLFIVKYDAGGNVVWARSASGCAGDDAVYSLAVDPAGYLYGTGYFEAPSIILDSDTLNAAPANYRDFLVFKMDSLGNIIWAGTAPGTGNDVGNAVAADASGNVFAGGQFTSPALTFGSIVVNNSASGNNDAFMVKYDNLGNVQWAREAGGSHHDYTLSVCTDYSGDIYVAGYYRSSQVTFGAYTLSNSGTPYGNYFLVKYNTAGLEQWAVQAMGSSTSDAITSVAADPFGGIYACGHFQSPSITFGPYVLTNTTSNMQIFVARFDQSNGNAMWGITLSNTGHDLANAVAPNSAGYAYVGGQFTSTNLTFGTTTLTNAGNGMNDLFLAKLDGSVAVRPEVPVQNAVVYPNPANDEAFVSLGSDMSGAVLQVVNCYGQTVRTISPILGNTAIVNLKALEGGLYFIRVVRDHQVIASCKVIVGD
ncbi:MAG TPA: T9SS type A sorting domain-containing protein [Bacteroidales bacterium]|nr:T9SS type A sorting domain-containing protein [Bacteroidales bacterium]HSA42048.1 T9SS type A sorting domain-containing protein [Bacteroidales bacterium]